MYCMLSFYLFIYLITLGVWVTLRTPRLILQNPPSTYSRTHAWDGFSIFLLVTTISLLTLSLVIASSNFSTYTNSPYLSVS